MKTATTRLALIVGSLAGVAATLAPAHANDTIVRTAPSDVRPSAYVRLAGLDLASPAGVSALRSRVKQAANAVCLSNGRQPLATAMAEQKCASEAIARAEPQIVQAISQHNDRSLAAADIGRIEI